MPELKLGTSAQDLGFATILASCVHDMKNSLSIVLQSIEALEAQALPQQPEQARHFHQLHHEALRLNNQMMQMLTLYKLEQSIYQLNVSECVVDEFFEDLVLSHSPVFASRNIELDWQCDPNLIGFFDRDLINILLVNALNNAQRFARSKVLLSAARKDCAGHQGIELCLEDDGPGFSEEKLVALGGGEFLAGTEAGDTGLGLYFSCQVAALHRAKALKGSVHCDNQSQLGGARLSVFLP